MKTKLQKEIETSIINTLKKHDANHEEGITEMLNAVVGILYITGKLLGRNGREFTKDMIKQLYNQL